MGALTFKDTSVNSGGRKRTRAAGRRVGPDRDGAARQVRPVQKRGRATFIFVIKKPALDYRWTKNMQIVALMVINGRRAAADAI